MLNNINQNQLSFSPYLELFDILIEKDNFWRLINESIDFSFIFDEVRQKYSDNMGRPAENPITMFKYILLKAKFKLSDRDLITHTKTDMLFKYFLGYDPEELEFIDPSSLSKFRHLRLVDTNLLDILIRKTVQLALQNGIINIRARLIMDSTHTNAMFQHVSPREELIKRAKDLRKAMYDIDPKIKDSMPKKKEKSGILEDEIDYCNQLIQLVNSDKVFEYAVTVQERKNYLVEGLEETKTELEYSKDKDAKIGHKTADSAFFGYKTHIAMTPERIITAATITSGEKHDGKQLNALVEKSIEAGLEIEAVIGDGAYSEKDNLEYCKEKNIKVVSKLSKSVTHGNGKNKDKFEFNKDAGMYVCQAGHMAIRKVKSGSNSDKKGINTKVELYYFEIEKCKHCPFKEGCYKAGAKTKSYSVKIKQNIHLEHMDYMKSEEFEEMYKERYKIEAKNGEIKCRYGYGEAQTCGVLGMTIQGASTLFLTNMKRIIKLTKEKSEEVSR